MAKAKVTTSTTSSGPKVYFDSVNVESLIFNARNVRAIFRSQEEIQRIGRTFVSGEVGLLHHPIVTARSHGNYLVCCGEKRCLAFQDLARKGLKEFQRIYVKIMEGVSDETAMRVLAIENMEHGTRIPVATMNEVYWHYYVETCFISHGRAMERVQGIWGSAHYVWYSLIVPGWLVYHCPTVQQIMQKIGPRREGLDDPWVRETADKLRKVRLYWWHALALVFRPLFVNEVRKPPSDQDAAAFDELLHSLIFKEVLDDPKMRGVEAEAHILSQVLFLRKERMEAILRRRGRDKDLQAARRELTAVERMIDRRQLEDDSTEVEDEERK